MTGKRYTEGNSTPRSCIIEPGRDHEEERRVFLRPEHYSHGTEDDNVRDLVPEHDVPHLAV
jgi:hypothetical protein